MKKFYYIVRPQLEDIGDFKETNGWKDISVYKLEDDDLVHIVTFTTELEANSQEEVLEFIDRDIMEDETIKLVEL
jgi:hypothetical protein